MNKFLNNPDDKHFHTSAFARVAQGDAIGASGTQSFAQRTGIDGNRTVIRRYRDAIVARGPQPDLPARDDALSSTSAYRRAAVPVTPSRRVGEAKTGGFAAGPLQAPIQPTHFVEPPTRGYNPYQ